MPQIGNARAAHLAQSRKRRGIGADAEHDIDPVAATLQRRAVVRRAKKDHFAQYAQPALAIVMRRCAGTARHQPAHAVADDHQLRNRLRPLFDEPFKQIGEGLPVAGNMQPAVVVQIDRRVAAVPRQHRANVRISARPLAIIHAQPMHQYHDFAGAIGQRGGQFGLGERQRQAIAAKLHADRQRVASLGQIIAQYAIQCRMNCLALV